MPPSVLFSSRWMAPRASPPPSEETSHGRNQTGKHREVVRRFADYSRHQSRVTGLLARGGFAAAAPYQHSEGALNGNEPRIHRVKPGIHRIKAGLNAPNALGVAHDVLGVARHLFSKMHRADGEPAPKCEDSRRGGARQNLLDPDSHRAGRFEECGECGVCLRHSTHYATGAPPMARLKSHPTPAASKSPISLLPPRVSINRGHRPGGGLNLPAAAGCGIIRRAKTFHPHNNRRKRCDG